MTSELQQCLYELKETLARRLEYNRTWDNVRFKTKKTFFEWCWFDHRFYDDPQGKMYYEKKRISPLGIEAAKKAVRLQKKKLKKDIKDAERLGLGRGYNF